MGKSKHKSTSGDLRPRGPRATGGGRFRAEPASDAGRRRLTGGRLWAARLGLAVAGPLLLLGVAEAGLRLAGWGYPTTFCLRPKGASVFTDNDKFLWQFYSRKTNLRPTPFAVAVDKPVDVVRIVILGESAAAGTPEPAYSFGRILERMLRHQFPQRRIEVINAAMRGVNSHIILPVARDCACLRPDLFVVYMGNNEAVGLYAPGPHSGRWTAYLHLLRGLQWVRATRLGQLAQPLLQRLNQENASAESQDAAFFQAHRVAADDPRRTAVYDNFRANLVDIDATALRCGAKVLLATVAANLRDCPPFGSLHRAGLSEADQARWERAYAAGTEAEAAGHPADALTHFATAAALDDHFAELHYRAGRCDVALGRFEPARQELLRARDWDALQFRADSRLNDIVRTVAAALDDHSTRLVDVERAFAESPWSDHQLPGERLFLDHVHPTFDGDYLLARALVPTVDEMLREKLGTPASPAAPILSRAECAAQLAYTRINEAQIAAAMVQATAEPPFTAQMDHWQRQKAAEQTLAARYGRLGPPDLEAARATFLGAIRQAPDDWQLPYNLGRILLRSGDPAGAVAQLEAAHRLLPHALPVLLGLSNALSSAGRPDEALRHLQEALRLDPESQSVRAAIEAVEAQQRNLAARPDARGP